MAKKFLQFTAVTEQVAIKATNPLTTYETVYQSDAITLPAGYTILLDKPKDIIVGDVVKKCIKEYQAGSSDSIKLQSTGAKGTANYSIMPDVTNYAVNNTTDIDEKCYNYDDHILLYLNAGDVITPTSQADGAMKLLGSKVYSVEYGDKLVMPESGSFRVGSDYPHTTQQQTFSVEPAWLEMIADTPTSGILYTDRETVALENGDKLTLSASATIVSVYGEIKANDVTSYTSEGKDIVHVCSKSENVDITVTKIPSKAKYETTYNGPGGILALKRSANYGKIYAYIDAGLGYMLQEEATGNEYIRYLNMQGLESVKIVCDSEVEDCVVNEG